MPPLAHSARRKKGIPQQLYSTHVSSVLEGACDNAAGAAGYSNTFGPILKAAVRHAALFHDLGKLDSANQAVLATTESGRLPLNHVDAGVAHVLRDPVASPFVQRLAAVIIYAHHQGLPYLIEEGQKLDGCFRDIERQPDGRRLCDITDERLSLYLDEHRRAIPGLTADDDAGLAEELPPLLVRLALSCLVDADHTDTARNYGNPTPKNGPPLKAAERLQALDTYVHGLAHDKEGWTCDCLWLQALDTYVHGLAADGTDDNTRLRTEVYAACRNSDTAPSVVECDSPVGSGKTTAVMAHLLQAAIAKGLRRIFVVLPFTNIIKQSVDIYRKCLVLPGERPEEIVAAHHHRAEYADLNTRQFSALWHAPVVVTTAV
jgi:CRISPR-associated endonuclease/helicase Cas3